jgi:hypothetical protein
MPVNTYPRINAADVRRGDKITSWGGTVRRAHGGTVESVRFNPVWIEIKIEGSDRPMTANREDATFIVERIVKTAEEKAAELREAQLWSLDRAERGAEEDLQNIQEKLGNELLNGNVASYSRLDDLLSAQARYAVWSRVTHVARVQALRAVSFDAESGTWSVRDDAEVSAENDDHAALTRWESYEYMVQKTRDELLEWSQFTSRSTSVMSNAVEDYEREAKARFASRRSYFGL